MYFEDLYNIDLQEQVTLQMYGFDGIQIGKHFGGELIRAEIKVRVWKLKNVKVADKD